MLRQLLDLPCRREAGCLPRISFIREDKEETQLVLYHAFEECQFRNASSQSSLGSMQVPEILTVVARLGGLNRFNAVHSLQTYSTDKTLCIALDDRWTISNRHWCWWPKDEIYGTSRV